MDYYLKAAFTELFAEDGLTVMGRGLGITKLFCKFAQYYSSKECGRKLVFCLNCTGAEDSLMDQFMATSSNPSELPQIINNEVTSQDRIEKYSQGGCFIVTSRILIVDLLDHKVDAASISGLLVYNAHRISETSIESFILKVFRERNRLGFVKGFSEDPEALQSGFGKVERLLRVLFVKKMYLWPRFRMEVVQALSRNNEPEVVEMVTTLTPSMKAIQSAILVAMNTCIQELKKAAPQLETAQMTLENGLFHAFDFMIKNQLESEWHRTVPRTKQLVADVAVLRKLLDYLIRYDAFSFYYLLMKLHVASSEQTSPSLWLMSEAANQIFKKARERVYRVVSLPTTSKASTTSSTSSSTTSSYAGCNAVPDENAAANAFLKEAVQRHGLTTTLEASAECSPKWKLATDVLAEIKQDHIKRVQQAQAPGGGVSSSAHASPVVMSTASRVLFLVKDSLALAQLRDVLVSGTASVCDQRYRWFISQQAAEIRSRAYKQHAQQQAKRAGSKRSAPGPAEAGAAKQARVDLVTGEAAANSDNRNAFLYPDDNDLLVIPQQSVGASMQDSAGLDLGLPSHLFAALPMDSKQVLVQEQYLRLIPPQPSALTTGKGPPISEPVLFQSQDSTHSLSTGDHDDSDIYRASLLPCGTTSDLQVLVMTHSEARENFSCMQDCRPAYVVLYDLDVTLIRTLETYQSMQPAEVTPVKVYCIMYEGSAEEHKYVGALAKEKKAFESLISTKEHMVISLPDHPLDVLQEQQSDKLLLSMDTRTANRGTSSAASKGKRNIVIDVREFRSTLPSMLYTSGKFAVVPRTLQVADYVLSPEICVERKGISDLFQSFASGRLYNQAESMSRYYKHPCLLIEFSPEKAFALMAANEMPSDILQHAITSRIALLALCFPNLRILWSRSAASTVDIFRSLVTNHEEVDVEKAVSAGSLADAFLTTNSSVTATTTTAGATAVHGEEGDGAEEQACGPSGYYDEVVPSSSSNSRSGMTAAAPEDSARTTAREILLSLPGINVHNFREVLNNVNCLADLSAMSEAQLQPLIGPVNAKKLYTFFTQSS